MVCAVYVHADRIGQAKKIKHGEHLVLF